MFSRADVRYKYTTSKGNTSYVLVLRRLKLFSHLASVVHFFLRDGAESSDLGMGYDECDRREKVPRAGHLRRHERDIDVEAVVKKLGVFIVATLLIDWCFVSR